MEDRKNNDFKDKINSLFNKIIDPNAKDRGLKIFALCFGVGILMLVIISLITGGGGLANNFGGIVNTYKDY